MNRTLITLSVLAVAVFTYATAAHSGVFASTYHVEKTSTLGKAACAVCHTGSKGGKLNDYGKDVQSAMKKANAKKLTAAILKGIEDLDSDKDGKSNGAEIKADSNPGAK